jgi:iron complex outermembrane receptor protein
VRKATLVLAILAVLGPMLPCAVAAADGCEASLRGRVVDIGSGEALRAVRIELHRSRARSAQNAQSAAVASAETDVTGDFALVSLCRGRFWLRARRADYEPLWRRVRIRSVAANDRAAPLALALQPRQLGRLDDVIVETAQPSRMDTQSATTLEGDALERTRGRTLAESLEPIAGVTVLRSGAVAKPMIRGQFGRRVLTLFDRVRHEGQKWGLDYAPEIDPFAAGQMTVVKGAAGVRFGPDALAGAILVDPLPLLDAPGIDGEVHLVGISNGRRGTVALRLDGAHAALPGLAWRLEGNVTRAAALVAPDYALDNTGLFEWNGAATVGYSRGPFEGKVSYRRYNAKTGVFRGFHTSHSPSEFFASIERQQPRDVELYESSYQIERPFQQVSHDFLLARGAWQAGFGRFEASYGYQLDLRQEFEVVRDSISGPQFDFTLHSHTLDLLFDHAPIELSESWRLEGRIGLFGMFQRNLYVGLPLIPNYRNLAGGVYAIERLRGAVIELEAGLRYDHISRQGLLTDLAFLKAQRLGRLDARDCIQKSDSVYRCPSSFNAVTVSAGALWHLGEDIAAKLDLSSASRAPNIDEQYIDGTSPTFPVLGVGSPDLDIETTWSGSATISASRSWFAFELSGYVNWIDDYIYFAPAIGEDGAPVFDVLVRGAFPRFSYRAVDALFYGADGSLVVKAPEPISLELDLRFTVVRARNLTEDGYLVFVPPDRGRATLTYRFPRFGRFDNSFVSVATTLVARQDRFEPAADFAAPPAGYLLLGAALGTELSLGDQRLRITAEGRNLLDRRYRDYISLVRYFADEPGLELLLRLSLFFNHS